jgi:hypothetical protein
VLLAALFPAPCFETHILVSFLNGTFYGGPGDALRFRPLRHWPGELPNLRSDRERAHYWQHDSIAVEILRISLYGYVAARHWLSKEFSYSK